MTITCIACGRPVPLTADEASLLRKAAEGSVRLADLPPGQGDCVRDLVRMGYLVKAANDDGPRGRAVVLTEHGRRRLAQLPMA